MKHHIFALFAVLLLTVSSQAALVEKSCQITANASIELPQAPSFSHNYDWSVESAIDRLFLEIGYQSLPATNSSNLKDGDLYTSLSTSVVAQTGLFETKYFSYTFARILQKDSKSPTGFRVLAQAGSEVGAPYLRSAADSRYVSIAQALRALPLCRQQK